MKYYLGALQLVVIVLLYITGSQSIDIAVLEQRMTMLTDITMKSVDVDVKLMESIKGNNQIITSTISTLGSLTKVVEDGCTQN